jgi:hypothetical protein
MFGSRRSTVAAGFLPARPPASILVFNPNKFDNCRARWWGYAPAHRIDDGCGGIKNLLLKLLHAGLDGLVLDVFKKLVLADAAAAAPKLKHGVILVWGIVPMRGDPKS